jgi:hypothetical protein
MSQEKLWQEEYAILLADLQSKFGGRIDPVEWKQPSSELQRGYVVEPSFFLYEAFCCEMDGVPMRVEISPFPFAGDASLDDEDAVEYLVISSQSQTPGNFRIRPEGVFDKVRKALKLHWEFETHDKAFDRKFNLEVPDDKSKLSLMRGEVKEAIVKLLPFEYLQAHAGGLRYSQMLSRKQQLALQEVSERMQRVASLAQLLASDVV